jgi:ribosomal protein S18 acetylase RimI-like enzyme
MTDVPAIGTQRLVAILARGEDVPVLQAVLDASPAYHVLTEGAPARPEAASELFADAEADPDRVLWVLRLREEPLPAGLLDVQLHWPDPGAAHVRLLLLCPSFQGRGLGSEAVEALENLLRAHGFRAVRLSVPHENPGARAFWERVGYAPAAELEERVTVYEKVL